jgi:outer membrane immunogenic protein
MKKFLLTSAAVLGISGAASAADLGVRAPIVAPVPVFSWTGLYIGIGGGTGWGTEERTWNRDVFFAPLIGPLGLGPFTEGSSFGSHPISGGFFGGQLGYNWQAGWAVFGIQGDAHWSDIDGRGDCFSGFVTLGFACHDKVKSFGSVTGRLGVTAFDRGLIYAKGGWAWEETERDLTPSGVDFFFGPGSSLTAVSLSQSRSGWTWGVGGEYAFAPNWSAFIEYNHFDFGNKDLNGNLVLTFPAAAVTLNTPLSTTVTEHFDVVKAGLNYKLNWFSGGFARY